MSSYESGMVKAFANLVKFHHQFMYFSLPIHVCTLVSLFLIVISKSITLKARFQID